MRFFHCVLPRLFQCGLLCLFSVGLVAGCVPHPIARQAAPLLPAAVSAPLFQNVTDQAGIHFVHQGGIGTGRPYFPQTTPAGCAFLDYDNDGFIDILLIQSGPLTPDAVAARPHCALYHNNGNGTFTDVTASSGLDKDLGYAEGVAVGDYDNDGYDDLFITSYGKNYLFHNEHGSGKFADVTGKMGLDKLHSAGYATSAAFGDYDNDGKLDLYVCYYCPWTFAGDKICHDAAGNIDYCSPEVYPMDTHVLYHNEGTHFIDVSAKMGISKVKGRGLAVSFLDYDQDGKQDIFVANDLSGNMLWHNEGGKFVERGSEVGVRYGSGGALMAGMGATIADYDQSGRESLFITNFAGMPNMLFKNTGNGYMDDVTVASRVGPLHLPFLSFGCEFIDYDADGWPDLIIADGHVQMGGKSLESLKQRKQLLHNERNGTFADISDAGALSDLGRLTVGRGIAVGDFDNDGRVDILCSNQNDAPQLMRNLDHSKHHWVSFKTVGVKSNRDGMHTRIVVTAGGKRRVGVVRAGSSFLSVSDRRVYFGMGDTERIERVEIAWPSGVKDVLANVPANESYIITEGKGITGKLPHAGKSL